MLLNSIQVKPLYKVAIYGPGGVGKTHIGATAPKPLILLFERQGFETVRTAAKMNGGEMPPVIWIRRLKQLDRIKTILATNTKDPIAAMMHDKDVISEEDVMDHGLSREELAKALPYVKPETVVVDSLTEACEMIADAIDARGGLDTDKSGLVYRKLQAWKPITDKCIRMIRAFRDLPYHVLFLCLINERNHGTDEDPDMRYEPLLPGRQLPRLLVTAVNAMGIVMMKRERVEEEDGRVRLETRRWVQFVTPDEVASKVAYPLRPREPADAGAWFHALEHKVKNVAPAEQPAEPGEAKGAEGAEEVEEGGKKKSSKKKEGAK